MMGLAKRLYLAVYSVCLFGIAIHSDADAQIGPSSMRAYQCGPQGSDHAVLAYGDYQAVINDYDSGTLSKSKFIGNIIFAAGVAAFYDSSTQQAIVVGVQGYSDVATATMTMYSYDCTNPGSVVQTHPLGSITTLKKLGRFYPTAATYGYSTHVSGFDANGEHHVVVGTTKGYLLDYCFGKCSGNWHVIGSGLGNINDVSAYQPSDNYYHALVATTSGIREIFYTNQAAYVDKLFTVPSNAVAGANRASQSAFPFSGAGYANLVLYQDAIRLRTFSYGIQGKSPVVTINGIISKVIGIGIAHTTPVSDYYFVTVPLPNGTFQLRYCTALSQC